MLIFAFEHETETGKEQSEPALSGKELITTLAGHTNVTDFTLKLHIKYKDIYGRMFMTIYALYISFPTQTVAFSFNERLVFPVDNSSEQSQSLVKPTH